MLDLAFRPDRASSEPLHRQLEGYLRGLIRAGRLAPGEKLPATREPAASLGLGRNSVAQAYESLRDAGLLTTLFYLLHAVGHVFDTARGFVDAHPWWLDVPGVYAPAVLLVVMTVKVAQKSAIPERA